MISSAFGDPVRCLKGGPCATPLASLSASFAMLPNAPAALCGASTKSNSAMFLRGIAQGGWFSQ